ncbi:Oligosaccharide translocation protein rft1 [Malassezia nana]|uniref:Man(5)GlcNAc(2)-PP-dolichol translocation protein RFT1 n=1 Tax=Malassezia nana TaxID=180528 RepID=A0AAF0J108_9BASI|nr:Oligosaccharide translocation protein rft1 [Malassezia nana]
MAPGRAARALLLLQVGVRLFTFVLNQLLLRTVSPAVFGAAHVQLELVLSIALSLARDGVRAAVLRPPPTRRGSTTAQALHNLALVPAAAGGVLAAVVGGAYLRYMAPPALWAQAGAALPVSVALYGIGAYLELLAEPLHARALALPQYVRVRVGMEVGGVLARALVLVLLLPPARLQWLRTHGESYLTVPSGDLPWTLIAFALARAAYGAAVWVVAAASLAHLLSWADVARALWPSWHAPLFATPETQALVRVTTTQAVLKLVLTEGDKLALTRLTSLAHQGGYALASNYGSVVARTVFQPLEESVRLQLARRTDEAGMVHALTLLQVLLRAHLLLGAVLVAVGPPLARPALRLVAGAAWAAPSSPAAPILATYCWYVPVMGINGLLEAFVQSVAPPDVLSRYSRVLVASSAAFVAVLAAAHVWDAESAIVWANVVALGVRAGAAYAYVQRHEAPTPQAREITWRALMPRARTVALQRGRVWGPWA